jgi:hypothetical protein
MVDNLSLTGLSEDLLDSFPHIHAVNSALVKLLKKLIMNLSQLLSR